MSYLFIDLFDIPRMTEVKIKNLLQAFSSPEKIFEAKLSELTAIKGIDNEIVSYIKNYKRNKETEDKCKRAEQLGIKIISYLDDTYPRNLKNTSHSQPMLFIRGEIKESDQKSLAIIGTRQPTPPMVG
jgi:DNA processing protein